MQGSVGLVVLSGGQFFGLFLANCLTPRGVGAVKAGRRPPRSGFALTARSPADTSRQRGTARGVWLALRQWRNRFWCSAVLRVWVGVGGRRRGSGRDQAG